MSAYNEVNEHGGAGPVQFFSNPLMSDSESDWSPVHDAAFSGRFLSLQKLLSQGASVNLATLDRVTPLYGACQQGHEACARLLIQNGAYVNSATVDGTTPLSEAYARGHVTCVSLLLQHGAEPQEPGGHSGSPIHRAASKGASVNSSEDSESLLHTAAHVSSPEVASVPVEHRADCSIRNSQGQRPVDLAPPNSLVERMLGKSRGIPP